LAHAHRKFQNSVGQPDTNSHADADADADANSDADATPVTDADANTNYEFRKTCRPGEEEWADFG
jgi:hypothetical protein